MDEAVGEWIDGLGKRSPDALTAAARKALEALKTIKLVDGEELELGSHKLAAAAIADLRAALEGKA